MNHTKKINPSRQKEVAKSIWRAGIFPLPYLSWFAKVLNVILVYWYYFFGVVASKLMLHFNLGWLYKYYNNCMIMSSSYDIEELFWKSNENR